MHFSLNPVDEGVDDLSIQQVKIIFLDPIEALDEVMEGPIMWLPESVNAHPLPQALAHALEIGYKLFAKLVLGFHWSHSETHRSETMQTT